MLARASNMTLVLVSAINFLNSLWGHWMKCQQLFLACLESLHQWNWYLAVWYSVNDSSVGCSRGGDPFWCSASSWGLLGWKWGGCRLAKSSSACPLSLLWVSRPCLLFFSTSSASSPVSPLPLSQSNYWSSCINCQHLPTWPCQWGGNSAPSWFSLWLNAPAPSFSMTERRCVSVYTHAHTSLVLWLCLAFNSIFICVCCSGNRTLVSPLHTNESFFFHLMLFSALLNLNGEWQPLSPSLSGNPSGN